MKEKGLDGRDAGAVEYLGFHKPFVIGFSTEHSRARHPYFIRSFENASLAIMHCNQKTAKSVFAVAFSHITSWIFSLFYGSSKRYKVCGSTP